MANAPSISFEREVRIAVVMYGGVSLAVYVNGVSQELLNLVRATAVDANGGPVQFTDAELEAMSPSARVYRDVARLAGGAAHRTVPAFKETDPIRQRFVIDILSGTSAGGINAVFLAKALANGQSIDDLARLWETEGDLDKLINDSESSKNMPELVKPHKPRSLLNSQRMFVKLREAFNGMDRIAGALRPLVDEVDLFVTTTDIGGLPIRLQLGGGELAMERRYRQVFHLRYAPECNDFTEKQNPFLAFCSRCTSSFPVAFEPTQLSDMGLDKNMQDTWSRHFAEHVAARAADASVVGEAESLRFGDGGYLDNKPFGYAIDAIAGRRGGTIGRVERKLIYIDPDPERLITGPVAKEAQQHLPNAVENVLFALRIPRYETIREELLRLRDRNRMVDKVTSLVRGVDDDFEQLSDKPREALAGIMDRRGDFEKRTLNDVIATFGASYGGCHRLKVSQLTDDLTKAVASAGGVLFESDEYRALRLLVREWRARRYVVNVAKPRFRQLPPHPHRRLRAPPRRRLRPRSNSCRSLLFSSGSILRTASGD